MGKIMINGEQYPSFVAKTGLDDSSIVKDKTWSSSKINEELEDVRGELNIIVEEANKNTSINDEVTNLTSTWSSSKIASEIAGKNTDEDVSDNFRYPSDGNYYIRDYTYFDFAAGLSVPMETSNWYRIRNNVCYFQCCVEVIANINDWVTIISGLPKLAVDGLFFSCTPYDAPSNDYKPLKVKVEYGGSLKAYGDTPVGNFYIIQGSYPIENPNW